MKEASARIVTFTVVGRLDDARREIGWIRDHSQETAIRNQLLDDLERDLGEFYQSRNHLQLMTRVQQMARAAIEAGPSDTDKALMRY